MILLWNGRLGCLYFRHNYRRCRVSIRRDRLHSDYRGPVYRRSTVIGEWAVVVIYDLYRLVFVFQKDMHSIW